MGVQGVFSDPKDIRWTWLGKGERRDHEDRIHYKTAKVVRLSDSLERTFKVGDTVYVNGGGEDAWVAHLVEMFQRGRSEQDDDEIQIVGDSNAINSMRCTLRWFYTINDIDKESLRLARDIPRSVRDEVYFSDHVEEAGSNGLEVIEGRAFLCSTEQEMRNFRDNPPKNYWEDDAVRLVRCFYGSKDGSPPPLRELEKGELQHLLSKPSTDTHLYRRSRPALFGVTGAVMKGTGNKKHQQAGSNSVRGFVPDSSPRHSTRKSPGRSLPDGSDMDDNMDEISVADPVRKKKKKHSPGSSSKARKRDSDGDDEAPTRPRPPPGLTRHRIVLSSDDDSHDFNQPPSPRDRPAARRVVETIEQSGRVPRRVVETIEESGRVPRPKPSKKLSQDPEDRGQKSGVSPMEVDSGKKDVAKGETDVMKAAMENFRKVLQTGSPDDAVFVMANLKDIIGALKATMMEENLDFDMSAADRKVVTRQVARQFFGNGTIPASSKNAPGFGAKGPAPSMSAANGALR